MTIFREGTPTGIKVNIIALIVVAICIPVIAVTVLLSLWFPDGVIEKISLSAVWIAFVSLLIHIFVAPNLGSGSSL